MAKEKQHIFSARTTEEGLRRLSEVKNRLKLSWDELVIDAVCEKYGLEKAIMAPPRKEKPAKTAETRELPDEQTTVDQPAATQEEKPAKKQSKVGKGKK